MFVARDGEGLGREKGNTTSCKAPRAARSETDADLTQSCCSVESENLERELWKARTDVISARSTVIEEKREQKLWESALHEAASEAERIKV